MPAAEQLNIRVTPAVKARFRERARREGMSQAQLLEALLKQRGKLPAPDPYDVNGIQPTAIVRDEAIQAAAEEKLNFAVWLQGRTGIPKTLTERAIAAGRVTVAGVPFTATEIPRKLLATTVVVYEGQEL
jgi:hypothetical protein